MRRPWRYRGRPVRDADVWPLDGGWEPRLLLVRISRQFRPTHYVPLHGAQLERDGVRVRFSRTAIEGSPTTDDGRWGDPAYMALAYWRDADED